jgi:prolipoprotein diacylglyceryltransferase/isoprenylcysteine carboxyl methyltransferase (ICMT) family protein YpbQ
MKDLKPVSGKILYALLFIGVLPILLMVWANYTSHFVRYPSIGSSFWGITISILGSILMIWGMFALIKYGKGLPMIPYPPKKLVKEGPYRLLRHPIYWGFGILLAGISLIMKSASGLLLVTPLTILAMIALVWGHEMIDLERRFPDERIKTFLDIRGKELTPANLRDRFSALFWVISLMVLGNYLIGYLEGGTLPLFGKSWNIHPIFKSAHVHYFSFLFFLGTPLVLKRQDHIREWTVSVLIALALSIYISLLWPAVGAQYFPPEFSSGNVEITMPFVLMGVPLFLILLSLRLYVLRFRRFAILFIVVAISLGIYQLVNSRSSILHLVVAFIVFILAANYFRIWIFLKDLAEKIANSWKEWTIGPIRIINHGFYVGTGSFLGILLAGWLAGKEHAWAILVFALIVIVFSELWAQLIEGSDKLKRPFGYYGGLVGILFAIPVVWIMGYNVWIIIGVVSVIMPWVQAIGRLRCLINGCCHGRPVKDSRIGIRYFHYRSRVCGLSGLKGELIHPTPLYAILWLFFVGFLLLAMWNKHEPYSVIFGLYLILTGIGRFVEEAYRGEVQTPSWNGLHLYQWTAIASVIIGIPMTMIPVAVVDILPDFGWEVIVAGFLGGLFTFIAMGVDFPRSNARFSRLV